MSNYYIYIELEGVLLNSMSVLVNLTLGLALIRVNFDPIQEKIGGGHFFHKIMVYSSTNDQGYQSSYDLLIVWSLCS